MDFDTKVDSKDGDDDDDGDDDGGGDDPNDRRDKERLKV